VPETKNKEVLNWALLAWAKGCSLKRPASSDFCHCSLTTRLWLA